LSGRGEEPRGVSEERWGGGAFAERMDRAESWRGQPRRGTEERVTKEWYRGAGKRGEMVRVWRAEWEERGRERGASEEIGRCIYVLVKV